MIGRFLQGFAGGVFNMINAKCIFETVPEKYSGVMGCLTNTLNLWYGMISVMLGMTLPTDPQEMRDDGMWRLVYGFPMLFMTAHLILITTVFK